MLLYVDETENDEVFIVAGLLVENRLFVENAYKHFKKRVQNYPIKRRTKELIYREFKSITIDKHYQKIKITMIEEICKIKNCLVIYSVYEKHDKPLLQNKKEEIYILLIKNIAKKCGNVSVIYDGFKKNKFEARIEKELKILDNVDITLAKDSQDEPGLQFVDNLCSVIRLYLSGNDRDDYFNKLKMKVIKV